jgi:hypothetical protein
MYYLLSKKTKKVLSKKTKKGVGKNHENPADLNPGPNTGGSSR